jgi:hypothetical protein
LMFAFHEQDMPSPSPTIKCISARSELAGASST